MAKIKFGDSYGIARYRLKPGHVLQFKYNGRFRIAVVISPTWKDLCHCYEFNSLSDIPEKILEWIKSERPFNAEELYSDFGNIYTYKSYKLFSMMGLQAVELKVASNIMTLSELQEVVESGGELNLTPTEHKLLSVLVDSHGRTLSRQQLLVKAWGVDPEIVAQVQTRTVDMNIKRLRTKLGDTGKKIASIRGFGYRLKLI